MNIKKLAAPIGAAAIGFSIATGMAGPAPAADNIKPFGQQEILTDWATGAPLIGYTVDGLSPSSDPVLHSGQLYEAPLTVNAFGGWATPVIAMFNARAESGANYRVIANAPGVPEWRRRAAVRPASSISMSWATRPTALSITTVFGTFSRGCPGHPRAVHAHSRCSSGGAKRRLSLAGKIAYGSGGRRPSALR